MGCSSPAHACLCRPPFRVPLFPLSLLLLLMISLSPHQLLGQDELPLATCRNFQQACAAQIIHFPQVPSVAETAPDSQVLEERLDEAAPEGSGEGAEDVPQGEDAPGAGGGGNGWHFVPIAAGRTFPLYDEFVPTTASYDYDAEPTQRTRADICACPDEEECSFEQEERVVQFSRHVRVAFCRPVDEVFKLKCRGARTLARVIGAVHRQTDDQLSSVNDTIIFCRCESGRWSRVMVEPWLKHFSFSYKCLGD